MVVEKLIISGDLRTDGSVRSTVERSGIGGWICKHGKPKEVWYWYSTEIPYELAINSIEYQAIIHGVEMAVAMEVEDLWIYTDSDLVVRQVKGEYATRDSKLKLHHAKLTGLLALLPSWQLKHIPRERNHTADALAGLATGRSDAKTKIKYLGEPFTAPSIDHLRSVLDRTPSKGTT